MPRHRPPLVRTKSQVPQCNKARRTPKLPERRPAADKVSWNNLFSKLVSSSGGREAAAIPLNAHPLRVFTPPAKVPPITALSNLYVGRFKDVNFFSNKLAFRRCGEWKEMRKNDRQHINNSN
jgi:hypothetical protein